LVDGNELSIGGWERFGLSGAIGSMTPMMRFVSILLRRWRGFRPQHAVIILGAVLVIAYGVSTFLSIRRGYQQTLHEAAATLESVAQSAEIGTSQSLLELDATLLGVDRLLTTVYSRTSWDDPEIHALLRQFDEQISAISEILILDREGREINSSRGADGHAKNYAKSSFFAEHLLGTPARLFIGLTEQNSKDGGWSIMISRPLVRDGIVRGVIAAAVPTAAFTDFFQEIVTTGTTRISLLLDNGLIIADLPDRQRLTGTVPKFAPALLAAAAERPAGLLTNSEDGAGEPGPRSFRRVPQHPLIVTVARRRADILYQWRKDRTALIGEWLLFAWTAATLSMLVVCALKRQQLAAAHLRHSEARLKRQTSLLQSTLENIGEGLSVFDSQARLVAWNSRFCELLDLPPDLTAGAPLSDILMLQAIRGDFGDGDPAAEVSARVERFHRDVPTIKERVTPGGRILQIRRRAMPDGAVLSIYSDITDLKASERKLIQARSQAEMANRSKSDFLANMSHELRTPLNAIIGFSEIISHELFGPMGNEKYLEYMQDVHKSSLHLLSIINDVLDISKIEAGKLELSKEVLNVQSVIGDVIHMMRERAECRAIEVIAELWDEEVDIWADERAMKQIFLNLLSNAIKFSKDGGKVWIRVVADRPDLAVIDFEDYGIGMTDEEQERALQPFGQAKPSTTRNYGGTGLGLPITEGLIEAHGGKLEITSQAGHGTVVRVKLPTERELLKAKA
jgi:signal transduction histidine kinase